MRLRVDDPSLLSDLLAFLQAGDVRVVAAAATEATIESPHGATEEQSWRDLALRIETWRAMRGGPAVELLPDADVSY
jgi:hypothetical protein